MVEGKTAIQRDLDRVENIMKFNKNICKSWDGITPYNNANWEATLQKKIWESW